MQMLLDLFVCQTVEMYNIEKLIASLFGSFQFFPLPIRQAYYRTKYTIISMTLSAESVVVIPIKIVNEINT